MSDEKNKTSEYLDDINNQRVTSTRDRVAHALRLLVNPIGCLEENRKIDTAENDIAHAVNLLESGNEEMLWACRHFEWETGICDLIDDACAKLGICLAILLNDKEDDEFDLTYAASEAKFAMAALGKALAILVRWFDDEQDVSEI